LVLASPNLAGIYFVYPVFKEPPRVRGNPTRMPKRRHLSQAFSCRFTTLSQGGEGRPKANSLRHDSVFVTARLGSGVDDPQEPPIL